MSKQPVYVKARTLLAWRRMAFTPFHVLRLSIVDMPLQFRCGIGEFNMNSKDRKEARYKRRKEKRAKKRKLLMDQIGTAEEVFCFHDMFKFGEECTKGVMWKQSAQNFKRHLFSRTAVNRKNALGKYKPKKLVRFTIKERGKNRNIEAPHIDDRQIQKTLVRRVLLPMHLPRLIYDNGASLKGKGLLFSQRQLDKAIRRHMKQYGMQGWIITADYKSFFPNADRGVVKSKHEEIADNKLRHILDTVVDIGNGTKGLPLGVETSQVEMIGLPSAVDSYMCCQMGLKGFGHYMDDYHIIVPPDRDPKEILEVFVRKSAEYGLTVSTAKTKIVPFGKAFKFCKKKRWIEDRKIQKRGCPSSARRARRKIKMFAKADMRYEDVYISMTSALAYFRGSGNHGTELRLKRLFYGIFGFSCDDLQEFRRRDMNGIHMPQAVSENRSKRDNVQFQAGGVTGDNRPVHSI